MEARPSIATYKGWYTGRLWGVETVEGKLQYWSPLGWAVTDYSVGGDEIKDAIEKAEFSIYLKELKGDQGPWRK